MVVLYPNSCNNEVYHNFIKGLHCIYVVLFLCRLVKNHSDLSQDLTTEGRLEHCLFMI